MLKGVWRNALILNKTCKYKLAEPMKSLGNMIGNIHHFH